MHPAFDKPGAVSQSRAERYVPAPSATSAPAGAILEAVDAVLADSKAAFIMRETARQPSVCEAAGTNNRLASGNHLIPERVHHCVGTVEMVVQMAAEATAEAAMAEEMAEEMAEVRRRR